MTLARLIVRIAVRSLIAHRVKSAFVGLILAVGTFLVAFFGALLSSIEVATESAITESIAGHLQIYDKDARDPLELFGGMGLGSQDVGEIPDFEAVREVAAAIDGVAAVLPMGVTNATIFGRNEIDTVLETLRESVRDGDAARLAAATARAKRIVESLATDSATLDAIGEAGEVEQMRTALSEATAPGFWDALDLADPGAAMSKLDWLDANIAPMANDGRLFYLRVVGTDLDLYQREFDRFYVVKGQPVPPGERGILISDRSYEEFVKNIVARQLDVLRRAVVERGESIAADPLLQDRVKRLTKQYRRVSFQLDPEGARVVADALRAHLGSTETDFDALLRAFLAVDDATIAARHALFYEVIAPRITLYEIPIGQEIPLRGFSKSGYIRAVPSRVWGTFETRGLEKASVEQGVNLVDLDTFRELYGKMGAAQLAELSDLKREVGVATVSRDDAEAALFGGGPAEPVEAAAAPTQAAKEVPLVLNAAVVLHDRQRVQELMGVLSERLEAANLGVQVVDWQEAAGVLGQLAFVVRLVLVISLAIAFGVSMIIVNNAMMMATLDRVPEIGTIRAVGGQRGIVVAIVVLETVLLALMAGLLGAGLAVLAIWKLGEVGIPAVMDALVFLFSGDRLYPVIDAQHVGFSMAVVLVVAVLSTLYPAVLAARVPPVVAMRGKD